MKFFSLIFCTILFLSTAHAQDKELDKLYYKARTKYATGHFEEARDTYIMLLKKKPADFNYNYELGMLFFYELNDKATSIPYFESALQVMKDTVPDLYNYLGQAYQSDLQYDKAIELFNKYSAIPPKEGVIRVSVKRYIEDCRQEKNRLQEIIEKRNTTNNSGFQVINLGPVVNSERSDVSPIVYEKYLIFTSSVKFDYVFDNYVFHSYKSSFSDNKYEKPQMLSDDPYDNGLVVDPTWNQEISSITIDNEHAAVVYENKLWLIDRKGKNWGSPMVLPRKINRTKDNAYAALTGKADRMVVALLDKKTKTYDLYQTTKKTDGEWNELVMLNDNINTSGNEHYPSFSEDGYTLYFSSNRTGGIGKYDIYKSKLQENNEWGAAELLPSPINSDGNDITYKEYKSINKGYFSSDRKGGFGLYDIYEVIY